MKNFCDECTFFPEPESATWEERVNGKYMCECGRPMIFQDPESPLDTEWGFYRQGCNYYHQEHGSG